MAKIYLVRHCESEMNISFVRAKTRISTSCPNLSIYDGAGSIISIIGNTEFQKKAEKIGMKSGKFIPA